MKKIGLIVFLFIFLNDVFAQQRKIYIAPDDHTDYMWSADEAGYMKAFTETLDYYIRLNDSTSGELYPFQSKWNCDGSYWVYEYEKNRTALQFSKLIGQIRDGKVTVPLNTLPGLMGIAPLEATFRDMYYAGSLEKKYDLDLELVINMEDQVLPLGLSSLWAGAGARYSWRGVCNCATKVTGLNSRPHEIYWYTGLDDQRVLMKWYSLTGDNKELGGYAEARDPVKSIRLCQDLMNSGRYPYLIAGTFGKGWDDLKTTTDEFVRVAKAFKDSSYQVIVSNEIDFFRDFEKNYGSALPSETISYGSTEWGNSLASLAEVSAGVKRSVEKLRTAEALYTLVALKDKGFGTGLDDIRERAWIACGLYFDHDWTADGKVISKTQRAEWARKIAGNLSSYVDSLYNMSLARMGELIVSPKAGREKFFVFNPLCWTRTDYCDYPYDGRPDIKVVDLASEEEVPFQFISRNNIRYLRIIAREIPPVGYKTYSIRKSSGSSIFYQHVSAVDSIIENNWYRIVFSRQGSIISLTDKNDNNHEWISPVNQLYANDLGSGSGSSATRVKIENFGTVSITLAAESDLPVRHISKITLFGYNERIELQNYILQNTGSEPLTYSFPFDFRHPEITHEEEGAILKAKQKSEGGHYADSICRLDWIALNHFAEMSDGKRSIVLSNRDAYFMKTGNSTVKKLDTETPLIKVLATGQIDAPGLGIINQDGDSYFENFFALKTTKGGSNAAASMKFSLEHQNPLVAGRINGKEGPYGISYSLLAVSDTNIAGWAVKPAEEGIENGIILRVWNLSDNDKETQISFSSAVEKCKLTTHIEKDLSDIVPEEGNLKLKIGHNHLQTYRIFLK